jgi:two-component system nitrate/nitrite response regulator NarL
MRSRDAGRSRRTPAKARAGHTARATVSTPAPSPDAASRRVRVLIADDHQMFREALRRMLQTEPGIEVAGEASSGSDVVKLVSEVPADILLLDMQMPGGSGLDVLRQLAEHGTPIHTILLTGTANRQQVVESIRLGARGVVLKDASLDVLIKSIRHVMLGNYWVGHERIGDLIEGVHAAEAAREARRPAETLTRRELDIMRAVAEGATNKEIGTRFNLSEQTVKNHLSTIFDKVGVSSRLELALYAVNRRLIGPGAGS